MKCYAWVKRCVWSFSGCIITRLDVGRNAERKYAEMAVLAKEPLFFRTFKVILIMMYYNVFLKIRGGNLYETTHSRRRNAVS